MFKPDPQCCGAVSKNQVHIVKQVQEGDPVRVRPLVKGGNFGRIKPNRLLKYANKWIVLSMEGLSYSRDLSQQVAGGWLL